MNIFMKLKPIPIFCYDNNNLRPLPLRGRDRVGVQLWINKVHIFGIHLKMIKIKKIPTGRNDDQDLLSRQTSF